MSEPGFTYVSYIASTPQKVWDALTRGELSREYWAGRTIESDWRPGSPLRFRKASGEHDVVRATVVEVRPPWEAVHDWTFDLGDGKPRLPKTRVTYAIARAGPRNVKLTVIHAELEPGSVVDEGLKEGWPAIVSSLKTYLETGSGLDVTKRWAKKGR